MKRRELTLGLAAALMLARPALGAGEPVEGKDYTLVQPPQPVSVAGKIEVIEFFGYWCPHCNELEPTLAPWVKKLPPSVNFRRIPVAWQAGQVPYQKLYYAFEAMGQLDALHRKAFDAVHVQHLRLDSDAGIAAFAAATGLDRAKLVDAMNGFTVASKIRLANQAATAYRIDGVPTFTVNGRTMTSPEMAGGDERVLRVLDALIAKSKPSR
jgi:thiol:disulfide interchange protein DsbA